MRYSLIPCIVSVLVLAACQSDDAEPTPATSTAEAGQHDHDHSETTDSAGHSTEKPEIPADARRITVTATDYAFSPERISAQPGENIAVTLVNEGEAHHTIEFHLADGQETELERHLKPNQKGVLVFTAPQKPGSYEFYCPVGSHEDRGMTGTLVVEQSD